MKLLGLLITCLGVMGALTVEVFKMGCEETPFKACSSRGLVGVIATAENIRHLSQFLRERCIPNAFVFGWNDHYDLFVLQSVSETLAPFDQYTNTSRYVLYMGKCPCPVPVVEERRCHEEKSYHEKECESVHREECAPVYHEEHHRHEEKPCHTVVVNPERRIRHIERCEESVSSCKEEERCPLIPKRCRKVCKSRSRCHRRCPIKVIEELADLKTYTFDTRKFQRRGDVVVKVCSKSTKDKFERFIINRRGDVVQGNNRRCHIRPLPNCLRCPKKLLRLKRHIERRFCDERVCLYVNDRCEIFVLVDGKFYRVITREHGRRSRKFHLRRIRGRRLRHLIKNGLANVEFGPIRC